MNDPFKARLRVPTNEQYAYIEIDAEGTLEELIGAYNEATALVRVGVGLEPKEWNKVVDTYLHGGTITPDQHERMNAAQRWFIHEIDKSFTRLKNK